MKESRRRVTIVLKTVKVYLSLICLDENKLLLFVLSHWDREEKSSARFDNCIVILICSNKDNHIWYSSYSWGHHLFVYVNLK